MNCVICKHGSTAPGTATVTLERGNTIVIIKDVPAEVCGDCGEYYLDEHASAGVMKIGAEAVLHRAEVEVRKYAA